MRLHPGELFHQNRKDRCVAGLHTAPHGMQLRAAPKPVNETQSGERLDVVIDNADTRSRPFQYVQYPRKPQGGTRVLTTPAPCIAPGPRNLSKLSRAAGESAGRDAILVLPTQLVRWPG